MSLLVAGCQGQSLKDTLTTPPPVSAKGQPGSTTAASAPAATPAPVTTAPAAGAGAAASGNAHQARSRTHRSQGRRTAAATSDLKAAQHGTATRNAAFVNKGVAKGAVVYPKFVPPKAATSQMTDAEEKQFQQSMSDRIKASQQAPESSAEAAERERLLKALAEKHAQDTLNSIEK